MKLNNEEKNILQSVEDGEWESIDDIQNRKNEMQNIALNTIKENKRINIRISERDLLELKRKALEEGLPYQTYVARILHKFVNGKYSEIK